MTSDAASARPDPTAEVVDLCRDLLRIDTTNTGDNDTSVGERRAAEYVAEKLAEVGVESTLLEPAPGRANVVARIPGTDPSRGALLVHGHLDVVPADADEWSVHPFSGELRDGYLWGRGAIDMKDFDAMVLAVVRHWQRTGVRPPRTSCWRTPPTRRPAATTARTSWRSSTEGSSTAAPRRSARSAASPTRSTTTSGSI
ncbi:hypothetical protein GCM10027614_14490 [Micromonospora vulcania]